jgi:hypothetical protein
MANSDAVARVAALAAIVALGTVPAARAAEVELVRDGKRHELSAAARAHIAEQLPRLFSTCSLNSRDHPQVFAARDPAAQWRETAAGNHLIVRLAARQLMLGLPDARYPEPQLSRDAERVVAHTKCSGGDTIKFVCADEIRALMPRSYRPQCDLLPSSGRRVP